MTGGHAEHRTSADNFAAELNWKPTHAPNQRRIFANPTHWLTFIEICLLAVCWGLVPALRAELWTVDPSFHPTFESDSPQKIWTPYLVAADGSLTATVSVSVVNGQSMGYGLIRLKPDGSLDPSFQQRFSQVLVSEYPGGKMMVVEYQIGSNSTYILRRLLADGSVDGTFSPTTLVGGIPRVLVLGDGRLVIYGSFFTVDGSLQRQIAILQANGGRDPVFTSPIPNTGGTVRAAAISPDGLSIWVAGDILGLGSGRAAIARLGLNGAVDPSFSVPDAAQIGTANEVYPLASGQVLVASGGSLRRLTSAGSVDNGFSAAPVGTVGDYGPALYGGKILYLTDTGNPAQRQLRRMNLDGSDDATFSAVVTPVSTNYTVSIPAIGADGNLYFGPLTANRYAAHAMLTRVNSSGQIDLAYAPRSSTVATFSAYTRLANGKHLVAGAFSTWLRGRSAMSTMSRRRTRMISCG